MKNRFIIFSIIAVFLSTFFVACEDDVEPQIEELQLDRVLTPIGLEARIRNLINIELTWDLRSDADYYVVEFSEDSLEFSSIILTVEVQRDQLPLTQEFFGGTRYSARVKGMSNDPAVSASNWATITTKTENENIFSTLPNGDIGANEVTLTWPAGTNVSHFIISPGDVQRDISAGEKTAGSATITGLTGYTEYTVTMFAGTKQRGNISFLTLTDPVGTTAVGPGDDLSTVIAAANPGATLLLAPGEYTAYTGSITIDKSLTIAGQYYYDKPKINVYFSVDAGMTDFEMRDLDMVGTPDFATAVSLIGVSTFNSVRFQGCNIHDFGRQLIQSNTTGMLLNNLFVDDCVMSTFVAGGGDFIDFRNGDVHNVSITRSTFTSTPDARDFLRMDAAGATNGTGVTATVLIDHCTFVGVSNTDDRITYVRFANNDITVTNNLFANTSAYYSNQSSTDETITFDNNNYFNAPNFFDPSKTRFDTGDFTEFDPGFADVANGDYTVSNQSILDFEIGDPRWRK